MAYAENLTLAGYDDWRLPNARELQSIVDYATHNPAIDTTYFPDIATSEYWTSTTYVSNPNQAFYVEFNGGNVYRRDKTEFRLFRCVRGGSIETVN